MKRALILACVAACADPPEAAPALLSAEPPYGPLVGGTQITLHGDRFDPTTRVLLGGREAPLAYARTSTEIDVVIPPGDEPGDAELVVLGAHGTAIEPHLFHYSAPPAITSLAPERVLFDAGTTLVTVHGRGFADDGAGDVTVLLDGVPASEVTVISDTELAFTAPAGPAFVRPALAVSNQRGTAEKTRAFRYAPGENGGLLMFSRFGAAFATFYDPLTGRSFAIPRLPSGSNAFTTVVADERGDLWGVDRNRRIGRIDFRTQALIDPQQIQGLFPALARVGTTWVGLERIQRTFGRFDPVSGAFTAVGTTMLPCCGSYGIAHDGAKLWFTARSATGINLTPIAIDTGGFGTPVAIQDGAQLHFEELRYYRGAFYATSSDETLRMVDPATGATTVMPVSPGRCNAMEVVE